MRATSAICGVIAVAQIPAVFGMPSTHESQAEKDGQIVALFAVAVLFFHFRGLINRLHLKKHGVTHPSMAHDYSL